MLLNINMPHSLTFPRYILKTVTSTPMTVCVVYFPCNLQVIIINIISLYQPPCWGLSPVGSLADARIKILFFPAPYPAMGPVTLSQPLLTSRTPNNSNSRKYLKFDCHIEYTPLHNKDDGARFVVEFYTDTEKIVTEKLDGQHTTASVNSTSLGGKAGTSVSANQCSKRTQTVIFSIEQYGDDQIISQCKGLSWLARETKLSKDKLLMCTKIPNLHNCVNLKSGHFDLLILNDLSHQTVNRGASISVALSGLHVDTNSDLCISRPLHCN